MKRTTLISLRINTETLKVVDKLVPLSFGKSRTSVINDLLQALVFCTSDDNIRKVLESYDPYSDGIVVNIDKQPKL